MPGGSVPPGKPPGDSAAGSTAGAAAASATGSAVGPARGSADELAGQGSLRQAFGGLTTRGRSFLAAGVAAGVCAYLLGQPDLLRVGLLLAVLPLVSVVVVHRTRYQVVSSRRLSPSRVSAMSEARVHLRVENISRMPTGLLMLQDRVPYVLGPRPRFVLDRVEPGGYREVSYRVRSDLRGRYRLGPLHLRLTDPFGMCELTRSFPAHDVLTVVPRVEALPQIQLAGQGAGHGEHRTSALAPTGEDDVIPRGYRYGDDLRRVHWRSTARYGQLMVRREEQPQRAHCTVLLDTRRIAYQEIGPDGAFEWAVTGAASVAAHLLERGFAARLLTDNGTSVPATDGTGSLGTNPAEAAGLLLEALAVVEPSEGAGFTAAHDALRDGTEGLLVAFLGELDDEQATIIGRMRHRTDSAIAFVLDGREEALRTGPLRTLRAAEWTAIPVRPGDLLPRLWRQADRHGRPEAGGKTW